MSRQGGGTGGEQLCDVEVEGRQWRQQLLLCPLMAMTSRQQQQGQQLRVLLCNEAVPSLLCEEELLIGSHSPCGEQLTSAPTSGCWVVSGVWR